MAAHHLKVQGHAPIFEDTMITVFTDGACLGNPGPGGWGVVIQYPDKTHSFSGHNKHTTNNRMELMAAIQGLEVLSTDQPVRLVSDSQYVIKGITEWIHGWQKNNWKNSKKKDVENKDLWQRLVQAQSRCPNVTWEWVKGHGSCAGNNEADHLATQAASTQQSCGQDALFTE